MQKRKTIVVGDMAEVPEMVGSVTFVRMIKLWEAGKKMIGT